MENEIKCIKNKIKDISFNNQTLFFKLRCPKCKTIKKKTNWVICFECGPETLKCGKCAKNYSCHLCYAVYNKFQKLIVT